MRLGLELGQNRVIAPMDHLELPDKSAAVVPGGLAGRLVVVSNRVPLAASSAAPAAGGLAVALKAALKARGGLWFGWSGKTSEKSPLACQGGTFGALTYTVSDLSRRDVEQYYHGFANRALWPICHYRLDLADLSECNAAAYFRGTSNSPGTRHLTVRR
jgi:trehalose 6-phosphate synthase